MKQIVSKWKLIWEVADAPIFEMGHGTFFADKKQTELFGYTTEGQILFAKNEVVSSYHTNEDLEKASKVGLDFYSDDKNWQRYLAGVVEISSQIKSLEKKTSTLLSKSSIDKKELGDLLLEVSNAQIYTFCHFNLTNPNFTFGLENELRKYLSKQIDNSVDQVIGDLTTPEKLSTLQTESLDFYKVLQKHWSNIKNESPELNEDLDKHSEKYLYLGGNEGNDKWDSEYYKNLLKEILQKVSFDINKEIKNIETYSLSTKEKKNSIHEKYKIDSYHKDIAFKLGEIGHERLELRIAWSSLYRMLRKIVYTMSNTLEVPAYDLLVCSPNEIQDWFVNDKKLTEKEIIERRKAYIFVLNGKTIQSEYGDKAIELKQKLIPDKDFSKTKYLEGKPAYSGVVEGKVFVFNWGDKDFNKQIINMPEGAILIAGQTRPSLMPAIRKASAIVTDEGGITSHAAIVSRELKIPCVIGTEFATKVFKTGDKVKVDAQKGTVNLIK
ncbi:hypothetical protein A2366_04110 [Candidatus Woesebacteria bacterium RIFOXYB1_FULL_33_9]|nr:MAG: hypothetical protein A2366_04110 [Candidatus Woesebacteria bacterium RIFOXYB1_FULL_33_9]